MAEDKEAWEKTTGGRKKTEEEKKHKKKKRPLAARISIQLAKTVFIRIPAAIIIIVLFSLIVLKLYLSPETVERLARNQFKSLSTGTLDLKVRAFSPYSGFVIEDMVIRNGEDFSYKPLLEVKKIVFRYSLGGMLLGHIRFPELGIYEPKVYLREKGGVWNAAVLMRPSEKGKEEQLEKEDVAGKKDEIKLPVPVDVFVNFILKDFNLVVESSRFDAGIEGLTFTFRMDIPPFKKIPLSPAVVNLLKEMKIELNPRERLFAYYSSKEAEVGPPLVLTWKCDFNRTDEGKPGFFNTFKMGTYKTPVRFVNHHLAPLHFLVAYDLFYDPTGDTLNVNDISLTFRNTCWMRLSGNARNMTKNPFINLGMSESTILLDELYPYYRVVTGDGKTRFSGTISLKPLEVKGDADHMDVKGEIRFSGLSYKKESTAFSIPGMSLFYDLKKRGENADAGAGINIPLLTYSLSGGRAGRLGFEFQTAVEARENFKRFILPSLMIRLFSPDMQGNALSVSMTGDVFTGTRTAGWIKIDRLLFNKDPLASMVPGSLKAKINSIPLKRPVESTMLVRFNTSPGMAEVTAEMGVSIPDYDLPDLLLQASIVQNEGEKRLVIHRLDINSRSRNFSAGVAGYLVQEISPFSNSDITLHFTLDNPQIKNLYGPWDSSGSVSFETRLKGDLKTGSVCGTIRTDKFTIRNRDTYLAVNDMNLAFPFIFQFMAKGKGQSLLGVRQSQVIDNKRFADKPNFSIGSVWAKHPARNIPFLYMKDFSAFMEFRDNVFRLTEMKSYVIDGSLYGRRILVNLGNLDMSHLDFKSFKDNIEYSFNMDLTNVDIGRLDEAEGKKKVRDAELSLNANFTGRGVDIRKELTTEGYINIFKVGEKFANRLMKGLSKEKGRSKLGIAQPVVDNSVSVKGFEFKLDKGLVYTTVLFSGGWLSKIATVENNRIEFDRIPIQEYLSKVQKGD